MSKILGTSTGNIVEKLQYVLTISYVPFAMNLHELHPAKTHIRPIHYQDLGKIEALARQHYGEEQSLELSSLHYEMLQVKSWYSLVKFLSWFPNPYQYEFMAFVAEAKGLFKGMVQISPFNNSRSTWRVDRILVDPQGSDRRLALGLHGLGARLLRHCFEQIWEARTWLLEVNVNEKQALAIYRETGFQPLAQLTYWLIKPETLGQLATQEPDLPNLLAVNNADAYLLYQLDTSAMPPLLRQVYDRNVADFEIGLINRTTNRIKRWFSQTEVVEKYVFEPQRKAAIGYFKLTVAKDKHRHHRLELTVHPAYTWLYPQLLAKIAQILSSYPDQALEIVSGDYQPEREEYLQQIEAEPLAHSLLMSRSVWHKLRETKPLEALQLAEMFSNLKPGGTAVPSRMNWLQDSSNHHRGDNNQDLDPPETGHHA